MSTPIFTIAGPLALYATDCTIRAVPARPKKPAGIDGPVAQVPAGAVLTTAGAGSAYDADVVDAQFQSSFTAAVPASPAAAPTTSPDAATATGTAVSAAPTPRITPAPFVATAAVATVAGITAVKVPGSNAWAGVVVVMTRAGVSTNADSATAREPRRDHFLRLDVRTG
jgi:hypothetical protein